ncbi:mechanosensitive ion channel family protein [Salidesulfovibrio brasiliensis]|uniref:mechanosensitive ion channel family protein n=1 Tax=Salidesulfovibrio brasiliensis TaxID=221711 RepID=UPI000AB2CCE9|nr:mechanosensitive ion channel domain-containing protein [Salidesulfovibrio brasiliensis]
MDTGSSVFLQQVFSAGTQWLTQNGLNIIYALVIFIFGRWVAALLGRGLRRALQRIPMDRTLAEFVSTVAYAGLLAAVVVAALGQLGVDVVSFVAILGAAGLAVGLALKDSLSNFAAGVMLILMKFFDRGDTVTVAGVTGVVESVRVFNTTLVTRDNSLVIVPNATALSGTIVNTAAHGRRCLELPLALPADGDYREARRLLLAVADAEDSVLDEPAPEVVMDDIAGGVKLLARLWVLPEDYDRARWKLNERIKTALDEQGLAIK